MPGLDDIIGEQCPQCKSILDEGICQVCGFRAEISDINKSDIKWVIALTTNNLIDAEMYKTQLESAEIPVVVHSQIDSTRMFTVGHLAIVKVYVPSSQLNDALEIIDDIQKEI